MNVASAWLAADPAFPQRDVLLDVEAMQDRFARLLGRNGPLAIDHCERMRVNYEFGKRLRALHRLQMNGSQVFVASRMFRGGRSAAAAAGAAAVAPADPRVRAVTHDSSIDAVHWVFPNDRKIQSLRLLLAPPRELAQHVPGGWTTSDLVAYAPEKTATAACLNASGTVTAFVKVAAAHQAERDAGYYEAVRATLPADDPHLLVPAPLAVSPTHRMLWIEPIRGRRIGDEGGDWIDEARRMGAAVARFHSCRVPQAPEFVRFDEDHLAAAARVLSAARPDLAAVVTRLTAQLSERAVACSASVCLHGDLHPKNALVCDTRVALLDLEDVACGPAASDLASFLAAVEYASVGGALPAETAAARAAAFLDGYRAVAPVPDEASLAWHVAASLLVDRAVRAVTRIRPLGLNQLPALVERASRILTRGVDG